MVHRLGLAEFRMPDVAGLTAGETRQLQVDVDGLLCGTIDLTLTVGGQLERKRHVALQSIGSDGERAVTVKALPCFAFDDAGHCIARMPPGRYFVSLQDGAASLPVGEFVVRSGATTRLDLVDTWVPWRVQVRDHDGATVRGSLWLRRPGWLGHAELDPAGEACRSDDLHADRRGLGVADQPAHTVAEGLGTSHGRPYFSARQGLGIQTQWSRRNARPS